MSQAANLTSLISAAVAERLSPDFIEKEVTTRIDKLVAESVDRALRSYSETGKLIESAIEDALRVDRIDLPSYGATVASIVKVQIESRVAELVHGRLSQDLNDLLNLAPREVRLSEIAAEMCKQHDGHAYGEVITVIVEPNECGSTWIYLDDEKVVERRDKYRAAYSLLIGKDGKISSATLRDRDLKSTTHIGRAFGLDQRIRAFYACGTIITVDEDAVVTSVGDF